VLLMGFGGLEKHPPIPFNNYQRSNPYLIQPEFTPLPYGSIQASGWLKDWCILAKNGMVLHNKAFEKGWIDGKPESFLNEQTAYWIDGMMRLGFVLHDDELISKASADIRSVIRNKYYLPSGWSSAVYGRAVMAYYQGTKDTAALNYMSEFYENAELKGFYEIVEMYKSTAGVDVESISEKEPRNLVQIEPMLEAYSFGGDAKLLQNAMKGLQYYENRFIDHWTGKNVENCIDNNGCINSMHGVTYNELAKLWAIGYLFNGKADYLKASVNAYDLIDSLHMMPYGVNSSMENIMGISTDAGTETCDISDFINSTIWLYRISGKSRYGDRIEKAFFNAAPAAYSPDCKSHVYFQSANMLNPEELFEHREVHDPMCCSGNQARLLPNYILHMLMATNNNGLAFNLYGPCKADVLVGNGVPSKIEVTTNYPFEDAVLVKLSPDKSVHFPFYFRIPAWCSNPSIQVNNQKVEISINDNGFVLIDRKWNKNDLISISFPKKVEAKKAFTKSNHSKSSKYEKIVLKDGLPFMTIEYGPLLFALSINEKTGYQYALLSDSLIVKKNGFPVKWSWDKVPVEISAKAIPFNWTNAPDLPESFIKSDDKAERITLIPYGSTLRRRISMFPYSR
jgi:hypothetical protein